MNDEAINLRLERFERTVATCLCTVPAMFSAQCLIAALSAPTFSDMFKDFGAKLPWPTLFVMNTWPLWALIATAVPVATVVVAKKGRATVSVVFSTIAGIVMFLIAHTLYVSLFLPILQLGEVAGGLK